MVAYSTGMTVNNPASAIQVKVTLQGIDPPIWRRLLMPADASLEDLHWIIQQAMGCWNSHLHEFNLPDRRIGRPDWEFRPAPLYSRFLRFDL